MNVEGAVVLDLVAGRLLDGSISIAQPFSWPFPFRAEEPLFLFTVSQAVLDTTGLRFTGGGSMRVGEGQVGVDFRNFRFGLPGLVPESGSVQIQSAFALELDLGPMDGNGNGNGNGSASRWAVRDPATPFDAETALRLVVPERVSLSSQGLTVNGTSGAALNFGGESFAALALEFDGFTLQPDPVRLAEGRADFYLVQPDDTTHVGWYDTGGFGLSPEMTSLLLAQVPDTLGLPSKDVAYLVLRDPVTRSPLVTSERRDGQTTFSATGLPLVLAGLSNGDGSHPTVTVEGSLTLDDAWSPVAGSIEANLEDAPLAVPGVPLSVTRFKFQNHGAEYALIADARLEIPGLDMPDLVATGLTFGPGGFVAGEFAMGSCQDPYMPGGESFVEGSFGDGALSLAVNAVEVTFRADGSRTICFTAGLASSILGESNGAPSSVGLGASHTIHGWDFALDVSHLPNQGKVPLGVAEFEPEANGIRAEVGWDDDQEYFEVQLRGLLHLDELMDDEFAIAVDTLAFGTRGFRAFARHEATRELHLFGGYLPLELTSLTVGIVSEGTTPVLTVAMDAKGQFLGRDIAVKGLVLGSDGTFALDSAGVNLLSEPLEIFGEHLRLTQMALLFSDSDMGIRASGEALVPAPLNSRGNVTLTVSRDHSGNWDHHASARFDFEQPSTEARIGDFTLDLREAGIDLDPRQPIASRVWAVAELYESEGGAEDRRIRFGRTGQNGTDPGIAFRFNDPGEGIPMDYTDFTIEWNAYQDEGFWFGPGFLQVGVTALGVSNDPRWQLTVDGGARLNLEDRVQGSIAVEGLVIDSTGIAHWGQIAGGDLTVMGAFALSVGKFDYHRGEPIELTLTKVSSDGESAAEYENGTPPVEIVKVTEYLHFAPVSGQNQGIGTCGGMAACLTLGDGIGGGVKELRFFQTAEGAVSLLVDSATLSLPGNIGGHLSLRYEAAGDGGGDDLFRASGRIYRGEDGFGAAGSFGRHKGELTYGLFVAASVPIHIVPGVIVLRGVGGGFFWRPVYEDYRGVLRASNYTPYRDDLWRDDFTFAGFLFGDVSIIEPPTGGVYYLRGKTLLTVTDASLHLDADASLFGLDGNPFLLRSQMYLAAAFTRADLADSARDLSLSAGLGVFVDFGIPLSGRGEADFRIRTGSSGTQWSLTGLAELQMLELYNLDANLWAGNDGLLARLHVERQLDLFILRNKVDFLTNFWWYREDQSIGAYAELNANVAFLGYELAGVGFQGALLRDPPDDLLYFAGRAFVDVAVYSGEVSFWLALLNGDWSGGRGANPRLEAMIAEAQNRSASITETLTVSPPTSYALSPDELATAGARLYSETKVNRNWWADELLLSNERRIDDPIPSTFQLALDQLVRGTDLQDTPEPDTEVSSSITSLNSETSALDTWFGGVRGQLHRIESILDEQAQVQLQNPLANLVPPVTDDGELRTGLSFWVDGSTAEQTVTQLTDVRAANQAREGEYRQAMGRISNNLLVLDRMMADRSYFQSSAPSVFGSPLDIVDWGLSTIPRASPPDLGVPVDRSISGVSRAYRRALEATSAYKARRIGYHWDRAGWADGSLSWFQGITGQLDSDNVEWTLRSMPDTTRARVFGERYRYLEFFKGVTWPETRTVGEAARELITHDMIEANRAQESRRTLLWTSIYGNFTQSGAQLWRDLHLQGLPVFADTSRARAVTLRTEAVAEQAGLLADHRAFTSAVHGIYSQMADLTSILYAMVDEYLHWRDSWDEGASWQGARPEYVATRQELAKALEPPRLTEIRVKPTRFGSRVENLIIWTATHPLGTAESAIHVQHQATDPASAALVSLGDANDFLQHEARRSPTRITDDYQVFVRARGPAGTTATRSATYTLTVGGTTYLGLSTGLGQVITVADATRPSTPSVAFDYEQTIDPSTGELTYWATDPTRIPMTLSSVDYDSDIAAYEVALGTTSAGTQVRDWAVMQGRRPLANDNPDRANTLLETSLTALDLVDGQTYWVSAKTENGAGRTSAIRAVHLRADLTPPTMPGATTQSEHTQPTGSTSTAVDVATSVPVWADPRVNTREQVAPSVRVLWLRSRDDLSGLKHYEFVATRNPDARHAAFDQGFTISSRTTATLTGPPLSYADSAIWVLVRARDHAGQVSEPTVIPRVVRDWTRPTSPMGHLYFTDTGDARFYITRLAMDPESGILGYQWSIGTEPGLNDLRPWSNPGDLPERRLVSCRRAEGMVWSPELCEDPPYFTIPAADLPPAGRFDGYFVNLRVINNAGILSHGISSGPATIEQQQPQTRMRAP